jgi:2-dehydro-3-deoxyphosphooctonate aldolase (KDO 8-P synthase)
MEKILSYSFDKKTPLIISGPCVVESKDLCLQVAEQMKKVCDKHKLPYIFKASYEKANRTSGSSFRTIGIDESLKILELVKKEIGVPVLSDVHESVQVDAVKNIIDVIQIPAFLCRQTELLEAAGSSGLPVNIKKGQFMAPADMKYAVDKVKNASGNTVLLTERGSFFGYGNLVVDYRSIPIMEEFAPVIFDVTHSVQLPGAADGKSGGNRKMAPVLAKAAAAIGVSGFFIETHPDPDKALSDGPNMIPLSEMDAFITMLVRLSNVAE